MQPNGKQATAHHSTSATAALQAGAPCRSGHDQAAPRNHSQLLRRKAIQLINTKHERHHKQPVAYGPTSCQPIPPSRPSASHPLRRLPAAWDGSAGRMAALRRCCGSGCPPTVPAPACRPRHPLRTWVVCAMLAGVRCRPGLIRVDLRPASNPEGCWRIQRPLTHALDASSQRQLSNQVHSTDPAPCHD
jgi:hypothetical protein